MHSLQYHMVHVRPKLLACRMRRSLELRAEPYIPAVNTVPHGTCQTKACEEVTFRAQCGTIYSSSQQSTTRCMSIRWKLVRKEAKLRVLHRTTIIFQQSTQYTVHIRPKLVRKEVKLRAQSGMLYFTAKVELRNLGQKQWVPQLVQTFLDEVILNFWWNPKVKGLSATNGWSRCNTQNSFIYFTQVKKHTWM